MSIFFNNIKDFMVYSMWLDEVLRSHHWGTSHSQARSLSVSDSDSWNWIPTHKCSPWLSLASEPLVLVRDITLYGSGKRFWQSLHSNRNSSFSYEYEELMTSQSSVWIPKHFSTPRRHISIIASTAPLALARISCQSHLWQRSGAQFWRGWFKGAIGTLWF